MTPPYQIIVGDVRERLAGLPDGSVQCCVTSPPYWGLRDYGTPGQIGLEPTPCEYVETMVSVFREVRRVLRDDGVLFLNLGDSYSGSGEGGGGNKKGNEHGQHDSMKGKRGNSGLKPKDLVGIPWRVAFALQADGWYLRSDIIWAKKNCMPESVRDRPTKSHEYVFLLSKSPRYFWDAEAVREVNTTPPHARGGTHDALGGPMDRNGHSQYDAAHQDRVWGGSGRNARTVWTIATQPYSEAHFATFPLELPTRCIKAGSREGDTVLDPFAGAGTTLIAATLLGRRSIGIELNAEYAAMAERRIERETRPGTYRDETRVDGPTLFGK